MILTSHDKFLYSGTSLPSKIDSVVALNSFRSQRELLLNLIRHCLHSLTNALWAKGLISPDIKEKTLNDMLSMSVRGIALLDCIEAKIKVQPTVYATVVNILESEPFLEALAKVLVHSYCK